MRILIKFFMVHPIMQGSGALWVVSLLAEFVDPATARQASGMMMDIE